jgi:hypothetical protein
MPVIRLKNHMEIFRVTLKRAVGSMLPLTNTMVTQSECSTPLIPLEIPSQPNLTTCVSTINLNYCRWVFATGLHYTTSAFGDDPHRKFSNISANIAVVVFGINVCWGFQEDALSPRRWQL